MHSPTAKMSRVGRFHVIVDDDAAIHLEAGLAAEFDVGPDAGGDHHEIGVGTSSPSAKRTPSTWPLPSSALGLARRAARACPVCSILRCRYAPPVGIELQFHQRVHQVDDRDVAALHLQAARGFESQQSAADHHGLARPCRRACEQGARVVQSAEGEDVFLVDAVDAAE